MIRCSALPIAQHCGLAPELAKQHPESGRAAVVGTVFHAGAKSLATNGTWWEDILLPLTDTERLDVSGWMADLKEGWPVPPVATDLAAEIKIALDADGMCCEPGSPEAVTEGSLDLSWVHDGVLRVLDYKTGWLYPDEGPTSLQLVAYGLGRAAQLGCTKMRLGVWMCRREKPLQWSDVVDLDGDGSMRLWERVKAAATAEPRAVTGDHCARCFQRLHCPARQLAALKGKQRLVRELAPFTRAGGLTLDNIGRGVAVLEQLRAMAKALTEMADVADEAIEALVRSHSGPVPLGDGRELAVVPTSGKRSGPTVGELEKAGLAHLIKPAKQGTRIAIRKVA